MQNKKEPHETEMIKDKSQAIDFAKEILNPLAKNRAKSSELMKAKDLIHRKTTLKSREVDRLWKEVVDEHRESGCESEGDSGQSTRVLNTLFKVSGDNRLAILESAGDKVIEKAIANGHIVIDSIEDLQDPIKPGKYIQGRILVGKESYRFRMPMARFSSNQYLSEELHNAAGTSYQFYDSQIPNIRLYAKAISNPTERTISRFFGWCSDNPAHYFTPSLVINPKGIFPNNVKVIEMPSNKIASHLDFKHEVDEDVYNTTLSKFVDNFLALHDASVTYFCLGAVFLSLVHSRFENLPRTILWIMGRTGDGKSFIANILMNLVGDFPETADGRKVSWTSSPKYVADQGAYFKDCIFLADDFKMKNIRPHEAREISQIIANIFDATGRGTLTKDRASNTQAIVRGFMIATAEDQAPLDAATMARTTTVYYPTKEKNTFAGDALTKLRPNLCKIPPQYIHWFLNQEPETFESFFKDLRDRLCEQIRGSQNDFRIATVTAEFGLGFHLLSSFLVDRGIWSAQESVQRQNDFEVILKKHVVTTASAATDEQGCHIFLRVLSSLLISGEVKIQGVDLLDTDVLEEHDGGSLNGNSKPIGFCKSGDAHKGTVYIDPEMAVNQVQKFLRSEGNEIGFSKQTLGQQLRTEGFFSKDTGDRNVLKVRWNKSQGYYWPLKTDSMGLDAPSAPSSAQSENGEFSQAQSTELVLDSEGLL
jgi:hypothetical protein